ncbi:ADP-ribosylation factor-like protein 2 isoform X3 [Manihot esculenta]|uniref:ADP-ribosylation factor-like protein 2 isoform X3 n=1 Tax=Manihot esculenta TaxID=3983 RepID=UPI001CC6D4CD|nr:ADP-ribosylation factor-like protein 2 isoform X3 [Manihot esculenta]
MGKILALSVSHLVLILKPSLTKIFFRCAIILPIRAMGVILSCSHYLQIYTLNIWDVGGQRTIRSYWRNYYEQTDGLVWVVDSSDLRRLEDCKMELDNLLKEERLSGASLLILANKQDLKGALTPEEIAKVLNLENMDKTRHWKIMGCSAYTGEGLLEGFDWLVQDIASRIYMLD